MSSFHFSGRDFGDRHAADDSWDYPPHASGEEFQQDDPVEPAYPFDVGWSGAESAHWNPSEWGGSWNLADDESEYPDELGYPPAEEEIGYGQPFDTAAGWPGSNRSEETHQPPLSVERPPSSRQSLESCLRRADVSRRRRSATCLGPGEVPRPRACSYHGVRRHGAAHGTGTS